MASPKETDKPELRPGDAGFQGFQMQLPENCIEYMLFAIDTIQDNRKLLSTLEEIRKAALRLADDLTRDYIWQRESFNLELRRENGLAYLHGSTDYGDCVEDEWLIVYLLRELTKSFGNLWVRVADSDGEFLLVEAANVLPKWLSPEIDANRVWIHGGKLYLVPLGDGEKRSLSLQDAVKVLGSSPQTLVHSPFVESEAFYRLEKYPRQISEHLHHSKVTVPRKLAYVLHDRPKAVAPATEAFYLRDAFSLKPLLSEKAALIFPPVDLVTVSVRFTKVLFAQLKSQRFEPPPAWTTLIQNAEREAAEGNDEAQKKLAQLEMGMKLTSGFEMLARKAAKSDNRLVREIAIVLEDLEEDGDSAMPTDDDIKAWKDVDREDDESWMDINYDDFERELEGKARSKGAGFGDAAAQADLKKIVSRFEAFLNDEEAGIEGAELDEMDEDDDDDDEEELDSDDDSEMDKEVSFDEAQFARMMREMMGFPSEPDADNVGMQDKSPKGKDVATNMDDDAQIQELMKQFESELSEHGALDLDPKPEKSATIKGKAKETAGISGSPADAEMGRDADESDSGDEEINIDYNLAKNLLESFKGQAGLAGPAGNILSMMGFQLPRDEGDDDEDEKSS